MKLRPILAVCTLFLSPLAALAASPDGLAAAVAADCEAELEDLFVHFYRNPELSFRELETSKRLAAELRKSGVEVTEGVGGTAQAEIEAEAAGGPPLPSHDSPFFRSEHEPAIKTGVQAFTLAVLELLGKP